MSHTLLLTIKEVALELQISEKTVSRLVQKVEIPSLRIGRNIRIPTDQLKDWVQAQTRYNLGRHLGHGPGLSGGAGIRSGDPGGLSGKRGGHRGTPSEGPERDGLCRGGMADELPVIETTRSPHRHSRIERLPDRDPSSASPTQRN